MNRLKSGSIGWGVEILAVALLSSFSFLAAYTFSKTMALGQQIEVTQLAASPVGSSVVMKVERTLLPNPRPPFLTIAGNPLAGSEIKVFRNGQLLWPAGVGYTLTGKQVTPVVSKVGDRWEIWYLAAIVTAGSTFTISPDGTRASFGSVELIATNPAAVAEINARVFGGVPNFDIRGARVPGDIDIVGRGWGACCLEAERMTTHWDTHLYPVLATVHLNRGIFSPLPLP